VAAVTDSALEMKRNGFPFDLHWPETPAWSGGDSSSWSGGDSSQWSGGGDASAWSGSAESAQAWKS